MKKGHDFEFRKLKPDLLRADKLYQREVSQNRVNKIVQAWNPDLVNEPKVSQRDGGQYYVFNGMHTASAHKIVYGEDTPILCKVFRGLTWLEEKDLFVQQNGISKDPTTAEKLLAEYNSGNLDVKAMVRAANEAGVKVDFKNGEARYQCRAVSALFNAYKTLGEEKLTAALEIINECWDGDKLSYSAGFILGIARFYKSYYGQFNTRQLVKSLSKHSVSYYVREAKDMAGRTEMRYCRLFLREYNKGRSANRIDVEYME